MSDENLQLLPLFEIENVICVMCPGDIGELVLWFNLYDDCCVPSKSVAKNCDIRASAFLMM